MTAKSNFRLASCAFVLSTIVLSGFIEIPAVSAAPPTVGKQTNLWDKIVFLANGAWQKVSGKRQAGVRQTRIAAGRGAGAREIAARRSESKSDIVALIPVNNGDFVGVAITDRPTFWFYISPTFSELNLKSMKFTLRNQQNEELWSTKLSTDNPKIGSGLMPITYKGDQLKADGTYFWELSYQQTDLRQGKTRVLEQKLQGNLQKETFADLPANQKLPDRISAYARNGIWHDLITELITKKQQDPADQQLANSFRTLIFESPDVKYLTIDEKKDDVALMEEIVTAKVLSLKWSN
jgi:Domain of Unknown Function (DUF928)